MVSKLEIHRYNVVAMNGYPIKQGRARFCGDWFCKEDLAKLMRTDIYPGDLVIDNYGAMMEVYDGTCGLLMATVTEVA